MDALKRRHYAISLAVLMSSATLAAACIKAEVVRLDDQVRPEKPPGSVQLLGQEPTEPYLVIAIVSVRSGDRGIDALKERLVQEAARLGGEAVILDTASLQRDESQRLLTGKVIVFERKSQT